MLAETAAAVVVVVVGGWEGCCRDSAVLGLAKEVEEGEAVAETGTVGSRFHPMEICRVGFQ